MPPVRRIRSKGAGGMCGPDLTSTRMALLAVPLMIGVTIVVMLNNMHLQHAHIHKVETPRSLLSGGAQGAVGGGAGAVALSTPDQMYDALINMPSGAFTELMQRVYFKRTLGVDSKGSAAVGLWSPAQNAATGMSAALAGAAVPDVPPVQGGVALPSRHPRGSDNKLLVLGVCTNIHNADSPMYVNYNKMALTLFERTFSDRKVVLNHLGKTCFPNERSSRTQIKSDYPLEDTDVIMMTWNNFDDSLRKYIREYRNAHYSDQKTGRDGLVVFNGAIPVPHGKDRPLIVADNTETWAQTDKDHDIILEAINEHSNWGSVNVWWPVAARDFASERYRLPSQTPQDLIVPPDFKPPTDEELAAKEFCAFMFSKCEWYQYTMDSMLRTAFFDTISATYKKPMGLAGCRGDKEARRKFHDQDANDNFWIASTKTYRRFKFAVAFENKFVPGYWTEKMLNAVLAGSIPIYAGETPEFQLATEGLVNPKRFIYCYFNMTKARAPKLQYDENNPEHRIDSIKKTNADDLARCVEKVKVIDQNNDLYRQMVSEPIIPGNKVEGSIYEIDRIGHALRRAIAMHRSYLVSDEEIEREAAVIAKFPPTTSWP